MRGVSAGPDGAAAHLPLHLRQPAGHVQLPAVPDVQPPLQRHAGQLVHLEYVKNSKTK